MVLSVFQTIIIVFVLFAWSRAVLRFKDKKISGRELVFWTAVWGGVAVLVLLPGTATIVSQFFGIRRPIDLAVYASILALFYLVFKLYVSLKMQNQELTKLSREIALKHPKKKK